MIERKIISKYWIIALGWALATAIGFILGHEFFLDRTILRIVPMKLLYEYNFRLADQFYVILWITWEGLLIGILQWAIIRKHLTQANIWILVTLLGWGIV
jgi:hypothetical protein